jgi:hypothetical protein
MMHGDEFLKLVEDIKQHGVRVPIRLYDERGVGGSIVRTWLIDGRNRMEAAERAGIDIETIPVAHVDSSDPLTWIIALNIRRRHLSKREAADLIVASVKIAREATDDNSRQNGEKMGRGRKPDGLKAAAVAVAREVDVILRTIERAMAKAEGEKRARRRRNPAQMERDKFVNHLIPHIDGVAIALENNNDSAIMDTLTRKERTDAAETVKRAITCLKVLLARLQPGKRAAA